MGSRTVGVVERRRLIRDGFVTHLEQVGGFHVAVAASSPQELIAASDACALDAALVSVPPGGREHLELPERLARRGSRLALVAVVPTGDVTAARAARRGGYDAVVDAGDGFAPIAAALRADRVIVLTRRSRERLRVDLADTECDLTDREVQVLRLISQGLTAREIAARLQISAKTVENHKQRVFRKLDVQSQSHAVAIALRGGLLRSLDDSTPSRLVGS